MNRPVYIISVFLILAGMYGVVLVDMQIQRSVIWRFRHLWSYVRYRRGIRRIPSHHLSAISVGFYSDSKGVGKK